MNGFKVFLLSIALLGASARETRAALNMRVVARVGGTVVTDRRVVIDHYLEDPGLYHPGVRKTKLSKDAFEQSLQRLLTQIMVSEENRIIGLIQVSDMEIESALTETRKAMGTQWKPFLSEFDLNEKTVRSFLSEKLQLRKTLSARARAVVIGKKNDQGLEIPRDDLVRQSIEDWLKQLRARYRVQMFRDEADEKSH